MMSAQVFSPTVLQIIVDDDALGTYEFGTGVAKHHFCRRCGIYPFHQTMRNPGQYRVNLTCIDNLDISQLNYTVFDGASL